MNTKWETANLAAPSYAPKIGIYDESGDLIAVVSGSDPAEVQPNAVLMAAAPDLLAALLSILDAYPPQNYRKNGKSLNPHLEMKIREAIAKATE